MIRLLVFALSASALFAQLSAPNQSGVSMGHIHLLVADPEAQKNVWMGALGAELTHVGSLDLLRLPGVFVVVGKARIAPTQGSEGSTVNRLGFAVRDLAAVKAKLDALHIENSPVNGNARRILARFPENVFVELTEDAALPAAVVMHDIHLATPDPARLQAWYVKTLGARAGTRGSFRPPLSPVEK